MKPNSYGHGFTCTIFACKFQAFTSASWETTFGLLRSPTNSEQSVVLCPLWSSFSRLLCKSRVFWVEGLRCFSGNFLLYPDPIALLCFLQFRVLHCCTTAHVVVLVDPGCLMKSSKRRPLSKLTFAKRTADEFLATIDHSVLLDLTQANMKNVDPRRSRAMRDGHYVHVDPEPLPKPEVVAISENFCHDLDVEPEVMASPEMVKLLAGDVSDVSDVSLSPWATPYGTSVNGNFAADSPFGPWGYGDGRAISLGVFRSGKQPWELQLKGAGRTPFSRNFDGRAVLRSCIREFLASEAMHHLGVI